MRCVTLSLFSLGPSVELVWSDSQTGLLRRGAHPTELAPVSFGFGPPFERGASVNRSACACEDYTDA